MPEINLQFTVNTFSANYSLTPNDVLITPNAVNLTAFAGFAAFPPDGPNGNGRVTFNDGGLFGGANNFTYAKTTNTLAVTNIVANTISASSNVSMGNVSVGGNLAVTGTANIFELKVSNNATFPNIENVKIQGGTNGYYVRTDGQGNITFATLTSAGGPGTLQYNLNNTFAGIPNVVYANGNLSLGTIANVKMSGGLNGYFLQTDGAGNLTWQAVANVGTGNNVPGGANTQVQFNRQGLFGGDSGFTYNLSTKLASVNNLNIANIANANILNANVLNANSLSGNLTTNGNIITSQSVFANSGSFVGNGANINVGNFTTVNATSILGTVNTPAQPNITSLGTLTSLISNGGINVPNGDVIVGNGNVSATNRIIGANIVTPLITNGNSNVRITANGNIGVTVAGNSNVVLFTGIGANISDLGANLLTVGGNASIGNNLSVLGNANIAFTFTGNSINANSITGNTLISNGNIFANTGTFIGNALNVANANITTINSTSITANTLTGNIVTASQSNITTLGNLTSLTVVGKSTIQQAAEKILVDVTPSNGVFNFDVLTQAVVIKTANATANFQLSFRGNSTVSFDSQISNSQSMTFTYMNKNGNPGYIADTVRIDGTVQTVNWAGGFSPISTVDGYDVYNINIIKRGANLYTVFGSKGGFY